MSHHFDSPAAIEDGRIGLCDLYVFGGPAGSTTLILTVNPARAGPRRPPSGSTRCTSSSSPATAARSRTARYDCDSVNPSPAGAST
jgi:hypothetical protein